MFGMGDAFDLYVLEQEGCFTDRDNKINNVIKEFQLLKRFGKLDNNCIETVLNKNGLTESELTDLEVHRIQTEVIGRF